MRKTAFIIALSLVASVSTYAQKSSAQLLKEFEAKYLEIPTDKVYPASFDVTLSEFESDAISISDQYKLSTGKGSSVFGTQFKLTGTATRHMKVSRKVIEEAYDYAFKNTRILNKAQLVKALDLIDKIDERVMSQKEFLDDMRGIAITMTGIVSAPIGSAVGLLNTAGDVLFKVRKEGADAFLSAVSFASAFQGIVAMGLEEKVEIPELVTGYNLLKKPIIEEGEDILVQGMIKASQPKNSIMKVYSGIGNVADFLSLCNTFMKWDDNEKARWATKVGKSWLAPVTEFAGYMNEYIKKKTYSDAEWSIKILGQYASPFEFRGSVCYMTWQIDLEADKMWPEDNSRESISRFNDSADGTYVGTLRTFGLYNLDKYDSSYIVEKYPEKYPTFSEGDKTRETVNNWKEAERRSNGGIRVTDKSKNTFCKIETSKPVVINVNTSRMASTASGYFGTWGKYQDEMIGPEPEKTEDINLTLAKLFEVEGGMQGVAYEYWDGNKIRRGNGSVVVPDFKTDIEKAMVEAITLITDFEEYDISSLGLLATPNGFLTIDVSQDVLF